MSLTNAERHKRRVRKHILFSCSPQTREIIDRLCKYWGVPRSRLLDLLVARAEDALSGKFLTPPPY